MANETGILRCAQDLRTTTFLLNRSERIGHPAASPFLSVLEDLWRLSPVEATHAGIRTFDHLLPDLSSDGIDERRPWRTRTRTHIAALENLSPDDGVDRSVLLAELCGEDVFDEWKWYARSPAVYVEQAMQGVHYLQSRPDTRAGESERDACLRSRLAAVPRLLAQSRANLDADLTPQAFVDIALVACGGAERFLADLEDAQHARRAVADYADGVVFVDLAPPHDHRLVAATLASCLP